MFTPQEVQDKKFPKAVFGGYDMGEVDDFLDAVSADYSALYKENAVLKSKLKVLAEKVEEYRSVDAAMRKALIVAQKMASEMTEEAKAKSEEIKSKARLDYENSIAALKDDIKNEERRLESIKEETRKFVDASVRICQMQIDNLKRMISEPSGARGSFDDKAEEIEKSINKAISEEIPAAETYADDRSSDIPEVNPEIQISSDASQEADPEIEEAEPDQVEFRNFSIASSDFDFSDDEPSLEKVFAEPIEPATANAGRTRAKQKSAAQGTDTPGREKPQEVNVGGMNIRVFEMELGGDKTKK